MKPILFNTEMVRAIQNGTKTVTRRVIKFDTAYPNAVRLVENPVGLMTASKIIRPPYQTGDILYVREAWNKGYFENSDSEYSNECWFEEASVQDGDYLKALTTYVYRADFKWQDEINLGMKWHPSIHMPKEAARIFLRVTDVKVERLQNITEEQAKAEGIDTNNKTLSARCIFQYHLWNSTINKSDLDKYGWDANPWVWVIEFKRISKEEATK